MRFCKTALAVFVASLWMTPAQAKPCLMGLKPALRAGHFSGSLDCRQDDLTIRKVGLLGPYTIYDYRYDLGNPQCPQCEVHGGQRVLIFRRGRYLGQYKPSFVSLHVRNGALVLVSEAPNPTPDP